MRCASIGLARAQRLGVGPREQPHAKRPLGRTALSGVPGPGCAFALHTMCMEFCLLAVEERIAFIVTRAASDPSVAALGCPEWHPGCQQRLQAGIQAAWCYCSAPQ